MPISAGFECHFHTRACRAEPDSATIASRKQVDVPSISQRIPGLNQTIESEDISLTKLFDDFYVVPAYQREYVWQEQHVQQLLDDIEAEFTDGPNESEYFIGSIVVCPGADETLELIDGQQRVTTAYIVLCGLRDYLKQRGEANAELDQRIRSFQLAEDGRAIPRYRVELQYEDSGDILERIADGNHDLEAIPGQTVSITNITATYRVIRTFLEQRFDQDGAGLGKFHAYFVKRVKVIRISTQSVAHALKIFETMNDRGVGLDSMDLLKNLMFIHTGEADYDRLKKRWKRLVDTLFKSGEKPLRFLRYFILATYHAERIREEDIYEWFRENEQQCHYEANPIKFVDSLLDAADRYTNYLAGLNAPGERNRYLENLRRLSGSARQQLILLLAAKNLPSPLFTELCRHLENLFFVYTITRENTREFERKFAQWSGELGSVREADGLQTFINKYFEPEKRRLAGRFKLTLSSLDANSLQQYRLRYLLGKLTQYVDEQAFGADGHDRLRDFIGSKVDVQHILSQSPRAEVLAEFDKPDQAADYIPRLGNLAMVEKPLNTSLGNKPYEDKRRVYPQSQFLLTRCISERPNVGVNDAVTRAVRNLDPFEKWDSQAIELRQQQLTALAERVWEMQF